jgi:UDP-N-acetylglucosamine transferase subunit ALG13
VTAGIPRPRPPAEGGPLVLVVVGTDVHGFDRLLGWIETWYAGLRQPPRLVVQYGHSRAPRLPGAAAFLGHDELQRAMADATVVISHGGPATITEARRTGHLPVVVPRDPTHGEHVDNHQQLFARRLGAARLVHLCESEPELVAALDKALADGSTFLLAADAGARADREQAVSRVGEIVEGLVAERARRRSGRRRPW